MNLLNIEHISKIYGEKIIFDDASFGVQAGDKIGIVRIPYFRKARLFYLMCRVWQKIWSGEYRAI